jgi:hypothetical protein
MPNPVISALVYTVTDTTIVATWTTDISADSNIHAGAKAGIDNGVAASGTSHQAIVTGLLPSTVYSCTVTSGATTSTPQDVTTNASQTRIPVLSATNTTPIVSSGHGGDTLYSFVSNNNVEYLTMCDGAGIDVGANAGANMQLVKFTDENIFSGPFVNLLTAYGAEATYNGTDGPSGGAMTNKVGGLFGMNGNLYLFPLRQATGNVQAWYGNITKSTDHGATWNNWLTPATFNAAGVFPGFGVGEYASTNYGWVSPIRYAVDDGTLGYNTAGNQIDGANGFVYATFHDSSQIATDAYLLRVARIQMEAQNASAFQYWIGPSSPTPADFVNDTNWSSSDSGKTSIYHNATTFTWPVVTFVPAINRYVMSLNFQPSPGGYPSIPALYEGPTPAGPWTQIWSKTYSSSPSFGAGVPAHRDVATNKQTNSITFRMIGSGQGVDYNLDFSTVTLKTAQISSLAQTPINTTSAQSAATGTASYGSNVTAQNILVAIAYQLLIGGGGTTPTMSIADSPNGGASNTWTPVWSGVQSITGITDNGFLQAWACVNNATGADTITVTPSITANRYTILTIFEIQGGNGTFAVDQKGTAGIGAAGTVIPEVDLTTLLPVESLFSYSFADANVTPNPGIGPDYILAVQDAGSAHNSWASASFKSVTGTYKYLGTSRNTISKIGSLAFSLSTASPSISGSAGVAGATVSYSGAISGSVTADGSGNYSIPDLLNGAYIITPSKTGYTFLPTSVSETVSGEDITGVNFTGTQESGGFDFRFRF